MSMTPRKLVIASGNRGKILEFEALLNNLPLTSCGLGGTNHFACPLPALPAA